MVPAYYNEFDPYVAQWLRNLIARGLIAPGDVDERSIIEVQPDDLKGYKQCHFFAGIGGWSYALRLAGWPDDRPVWTGSCPCQPFSSAGAQRGSEDERHLWPAFFRLIRECRPRSVFGEQVAGAAGLAWLDHVCADLEGAGYAAAAADLPACSVGAPHKRQRLFWVAHADWPSTARHGQYSGESQAESGLRSGFGDCGGDGSVAYADSNGQHARRGIERGEACAGGEYWHDLDRRGHMGDAGSARLPTCEQQKLPGAHRDDERRAVEQSGGAWADLEWLRCSDGKARPTQPGLFPLANGIPNRVGRLRAFGNAIVPQVAAVFVMANGEARGAEPNSSAKRPPRRES